MPKIRPATELKHPNLQGEYPCQYCGKVFHHSASLRRHRDNHHANDQQCLLCHQKISSSDNVRRHMMMAHDIEKIYTCSCCNWSFKEKRDLRTHLISMEKTGQPGEGLAVAMCGAKPGPIIQSAAHEEKRPLKRKRSGERQPSEGLAIDVCGAKPGLIIQSAAQEEKRPLKRKYTKCTSPPPCETLLDKNPEKLMAHLSKLMSEFEPILEKSDKNKMEIEIIPSPKVIKAKESVKIVKMDLGHAFSFQLVLKPCGSTPSPSSISDLSKVFGAPIVLKT